MRHAQNAEVVDLTGLLLRPRSPKIDGMTDEPSTSSSATQLMRAVKNNPADPIAVVLSTVLIIAGVLELPDRWGITTGQLAVILGAVGTCAAALRAWWIARRS